MSDTTDEPNGTVTVALAAGGYTLGSPASADVDVSDDDDPPPEITIEGVSGVTEGTAARFALIADPAPTADLTVSLTVSESSVSDYVAVGDQGSKTATFPANTTQFVYSVPTQPDTADEPHGTVTVAVGTGTGYTVGTAGSAGVTVWDDDAPPGGGPTAGGLVSNTGQDGRRLPLG